MIVKIVKIPYDICHIIKMMMDIPGQIPYNRDSMLTNSAPPHRQCGISIIFEVGDLSY